MKKVRGAVFNDPAAEDWTKRGAWDLPLDVDALEAAIAPKTLAEFMDLPAAAAMPRALRTAVERRLRETPE